MREKDEDSEHDITAKWPKVPDEYPMVLADVCQRKKKDAGNSRSTLASQSGGVNTRRVQRFTLQVQYPFPIRTITPVHMSASGPFPTRRHATGKI